MEPDNDQTQSFVALAKGTEVGHYKIIDKIGAGGMGEVYLAEDAELDRKVALKFLSSQLCQDEECRKRFKREAQAAAKLDHPNIVTVYEVGEYQGRPYFAMAHIEGQSLKEFSSGKELSIDQILEFGIQICEGLQAAHGKGITHRDIKPSNILIDLHGRARIVDFGLAAVHGSDQLTKTGSTLGTIGYMSPEQIEGKATDARSDLFSLGVVLYELIANKPPFRRDDETATIKAILQDTPEPLARYKSGVSEDLQRIASKLLEKDPTLRYQSAAGVIPDLKKLSSTTSSSMVIERKRDRWNRYVVPSAVVLLLAVLAVWYFVIRTGQVPKSDDRKGLVVLPFENLGTQEDAYFADGMTDEITAKLAGIGGLRVISRASAVYYKGSDKPLKDIARELNVDYVLGGTIRWDKSGDTDRVRIIPQLIRASDDSHIWAATLERELTQVFAVQADIAEQVATALNVNLLGEERRTLKQTPTDNMEAYDYYLRGLELYHAFRDHRDLEMAVSLFERATTLDTTFVSAYAELSKSHSTVFWFGFDKTKERAISARSTAERAMALDSSNTSARVALGYCYYYFERDFDRALSEFEYARKINANDADILTAIAYIERRQGDWEDSYNMQSRALTMDPLSAVIRTNLVETARVMRRFDKADSLAAKGSALFPNNPDYFLLQLGLNSIARNGDVYRALALLDSIPARVPRYQTFLFWSSWWYHLLLRRYEDALAAILEHGKHCETPEDTADFLVSLAETYYLLERTDQSRACYDTARVFLEMMGDRDSILGSFLPPSLGLVYSRLGENAKAIQAARGDSALLPLSDDTYLGTEPLVDLAVTYARVGEPDKALDLIDTLLSIPSDVTVAILKIDPNYDPLRDHPRFQALIKKYEKKYE